MKRNKHVMDILFPLNHDVGIIVLQTSLYSNAWRLISAVSI